MQNKIFIGSLPWGVDNDRLQEVFSEFGTITDAHVARDRETGRSRGFGFVEFSSDAEAQAAIDAMDGKELDGRTIVVNIAKAKRD